MICIMGKGTFQAYADSEDLDQLMHTHSLGPVVQNIVSLS